MVRNETEQTGPSRITQSSLRSPLVRLSQQMGRIESMVEDIAKNSEVGTGSGQLHPYLLPPGMMSSSKLSSQGWISLPVSPNCVCAQLCLILCDPKNCTPQAPLSMEFSRQEFWGGFLFPTPGDLPDPGIKPMSAASLGIGSRFFTTGPPGKPCLQIRHCKREGGLSWNIFQHGLENYLHKFYPTEVSSGWTFNPEWKCTEAF